MNEVDYVVVGAGSAGCVIANRLTEDPGTRVLLLEAGGSDSSVFIRMPSALSIPMNTTKYNWGYRTVAEPFLDGRRLDCPRGRVIGGSSSINGMVYVRGHPCDFEEWQSLGAAGWDYAGCLPYFRKAETWMNGADRYRGGDGPLATCNGNGMRNPLYRAFIKAGQQAGYPVTKDVNGYQQEGFGKMDMTVDGGVRCSTAHAYLRPALRRPNLALLTNVSVTAIRFDGKTATGVNYISGGRAERAVARAEVIVCAGSIGSPLLLQRSGIGPAKVLNDAGIPVLHELPGVGENLQDHIEVYFQYRCKEPITLNSKLSWFSKAMIGAQWLTTRSGLGGTNHFESGAFIRSRAGVRWPDIQFHFLPAAMRYDGRTAFAGHGFQVHVGPNKPASRGSVRIRSAAVNAEPEIRFNYLSADKDREDWRSCLKLAREILNQPAMDAYRGDEIQPARDLDQTEEVDAWVRQNVESAYHPSCSCKIGANDDRMAVLTPDCKVRGLSRLRVVDSSVFPTITNGNLNAPTIMAAEKAADMIRGRPPLSDPADFWLDEHWQRRQRPSAPARSP